MGGEYSQQNYLNGVIFPSYSTSGALLRIHRYLLERHNINLLYGEVEIYGDNIIEESIDPETKEESRLPLEEQVSIAYKNIISSFRYESRDDYRDPYLVSFPQVIPYPPNIIEYTNI